MKKAILVVCCLVVVLLSYQRVIGFLECGERCKNSNVLRRAETGSGTPEYFCDRHSGGVFGWPMQTIGASDGSFQQVSGTHDVKVLNGDACTYDCSPLSEATMKMGWHGVLATVYGFQNFECVTTTGS
jgi:hypothetical protein